MSDIVVAAGAGGRLARVDSAQFGVNFLFHSDIAQIGGEYHQVVNQTRAGVLRYPGGTISEQYFDPGNPDAATARDVVAILTGAPVVETRTTEGLGDFLAFCGTTGRAATIVLPTYRYFDPGTGGLAAGAEAEIKGFVTKLIAGVWGHADIHSIEIGNEWYQDKFDWTAREFASLQARIAGWVRDANDAQDRQSAIRILAQAGRSEAENDILARAFNGHEGDVDGVITHLYATNGSGDGMAIGSGSAQRLESITETWERLLDKDVPISVTEWNIGESGPETSLINGLERTAPLMRVFAEMVAHDVEMAAIWTGQNVSPAALAPVEGGGTALTPTGYFFYMLSTALPGTALQIPTEVPKLEVGGREVGYHYSFTSKEKAVLYLVSGSDGALDLDVDVSALAAGAYHVSAAWLEAAPGSVADAYDARAALRVDPSFDVGRDGTVDIQLDAYETVEITFTYSGGLTLRGDPVRGVADSFAGSRFGDDLSGGGGNDRLMGKGGNDRFDPGTGDDTVLGGRGNDTVSYQGAGAGVSVYLASDLAETAAGIDRLASIETVEGSEFADRLFGDGGNGLFGNGGDDFLWITGKTNRADGGAGDDIIDARVGGGTLSGDLGADQILGGMLQIRAFGGGGADRIIGSTANDLIDGGSGDDLLTGGAGRDRFVFATGDGKDRITDFEPGRDLLVLHHDAADLNAARIRQAAEAAVLEIGGDSIAFGGLDAATLDLLDLLG
ncbi:hypothetical protein [Chachezhania sediminis]|uniref:hypothetical protein n=1 Tax=Chachezhania sediminis TaxID=2599291 RepID=UPI00131CDA8B|nr:hypothetical protein [Chachezhania sediminis]